MFLAWYALAEPTFLTGLEGIDTFRVFNDVFTYFRGTASTEPELLSAVGLMAGLCPWCCGDETEWAALGELCRTRAAELAPAGFAAAHFEGRGAYGQYFAHMPAPPVIRASTTSELAFEVPPGSAPHALLRHPLTHTTHATMRSTAWLRRSVWAVLGSNQ